jgi:hypothetical protein
MFLNNIDCEIFTQWNLKKNLNIIQMINDYSIENIYDLIKQTQSML